MGKPEGRNHLVQKLKEMRRLGRPMRRWEDNIRMDLKETRWVDMAWIDLDKDMW